MDTLLPRLFAGLVILAVLALELGLLWAGIRLLLKTPRTVVRTMAGVLSLLAMLALLPVARVIVILAYILLTGGSFS